MRNLGLWRSFGHVFGSGLANELLDRLFPAPPTWRERFLDKFTESMLAVLPYVVERMAPPDPKPAAKPAEAAPPIPIRVPPPPYKALGLFTCPKCGEHTWGWTGEQGRDENGTYIRACTSDIVPAMRCGFTWKATEDHLYFAPPTVDDHKRSEPQTCASPPRWQWSPEDEAVQVAMSKQWPSEPPPPIDALGKDLASLRKALGERDPRPAAGTTLIGRAVKFIQAADKLGSEGDLFKAVGDRRRDDETTVMAAARLIAEADAYIAKQAEQIRGLILDNEFSPGSGEFSVMLNPDIAHGWGMRPGRVAVVLNDGEWSIRNGTSLEPIKWNQAYLLLEEIEHPVFLIDDAAEPDSHSVGGKTSISADAQLVAAQEAAKRSVVGGKVPLQESVEVAAFVDDAEKEKQERERRYDPRQWDRYMRKSDEEKARSAADKQTQIDETEMAQNAAGGVA